MSAVAQAPSDSVGPPVPRLALRVGVTGHRPNHLRDADGTMLRSSVRSVLEAVRRVADDARADAGSAYTSGPPILRVVSPLAEGADRIVAQEGLELGFELQCPLPFDRTEYERDFEGDESIAEFRALLGKATSVLELDGMRDTRDQEAESYEIAGRITLNHCDVLVAIWDGEESRGAGGTAGIVHTAGELGIATVWIDPRPPHTACLLAYDRVGGRTQQALDELPHRLRSAVLPPVGEEEAETLTSASGPLQAYFEERQPRHTAVGWAWGVFIGLAADLRLRAPRIRVAAFEATTEAEWRREWGAGSGLPQQVSGQVDRSVQRAYAWADGLAVYYANAYRSSFVLYYCLGVLATLLALVVDASGLAGRHEQVTRILRVGSFVSVLLILLIWVYANRRRWHERWIDYRLLAELLRQLRFLALLGRTPSFSRPSTHDPDARSQSSWPGWYLRALTRQAGMVDARLTPSLLEAIRVLLREGLVEAESRYHQGNARRLGRMDDRLRKVGSVAFVLALAALGVLVVREKSWVTLVASFLPVLGGALSAIRSQSELGRVVKRSRAMGLQLESIAADLAGQSASLASTKLARSAETAAQAMIAEVLDWQVVFQENSLELGG